MAEGDGLGWRAALPTDLQNHESLTPFKEVKDLGAGYLDLTTKYTEAGKKTQELEGRLKDAIFVPGDKATEQERTQFFAKLGRPETADKYTITKPADLPEGIQYSAEVEKAFKDFAHKSGFSDAQAKATYDWYFGLIKNGHAQQAQAEKAATDAAVNSLKDEWKGDAFNVNSTLANRVFKKFAGDKPEVTKFIEETKVNGLPLGNHPIFLRLFAAIGKVISDDSLNAGERGGGGGEVSEEESAKKRFPNTKF
jgi:hypothetical protein